MAIGSILPPLYSEPPWLKDISEVSAVFDWYDTVVYRVAKQDGGGNAVEPLAVYGGRHPSAEPDQSSEGQQAASVVANP
ncbi:putative alpha beta-hydrolase [Rosellinia necatrix]|uniref:Putative alpha beta-hydrolase n=1 Tax=Rosellinia necatrix TaxID=77044 RepID=A0A1S8A6V2_ROSNE|nr:putative alpha beta-hydrolase [Rosellinia necatrix]